MSRFNTQEICTDCDATEKRHPAYKAAADAEFAACKRGDYNYRGSGLPPGFHEWARKNAEPGIPSRA